MSQPKLKKAWDKLLKDCVKTAKQMGAEDPTIYIEGNSGLIVFDGPSHDEADRPRHHAMLFTLPWPKMAWLEISSPPDVGAW